MALASLFHSYTYYHDHLLYKIGLITVIHVIHEMMYRLKIQILRNAIQHFNGLSSTGNVLNINLMNAIIFGTKKTFVNGSILIFVLNGNANFPLFYNVLKVSVPTVNIQAHCTEFTVLCRLEPRCRCPRPLVKLGKYKRAGEGNGSTQLYYNLLHSTTIYYTLLHSTTIYSTLLH